MTQSCNARSIFLVFEYCAHDLARLVDSMPRPFTQSEVKCLMLQASSIFPFPCCSFCSLGAQYLPYFAARVQQLLMSY